MWFDLDMAIKLPFFFVHAHESQLEIYSENEMNKKEQSRISNILTKTEVGALFECSSPRT